VNACCRFAVAFLASAAAGCTSAPVRYYTLTPAAEESAPSSQTIPAVEVRVIHTPPQLNRAELMVRTGPAEMTLLENERWASSVKDEIRDALRLDLQHRLRHASGLPSGISKLTLDIDVQHFEAELGRHVLIAVSWSITLSPAGERSDGPHASCALRLDEKISAGYEEMVKGYQREIAALADAVAAEIIRRARGIEPACQPTRS
jgi:uncharacterized lipoprotein YmbA